MSWDSIGSSLLISAIALLAFALYAATGGSLLARVGLDLASIPCVLVYDRDGKLHTRFDDTGDFGDDGFTYEKNVLPLVKQLIEN